MKVVICGAGQVGANIARYLAREQTDITIIDQEASLVEKIADSLEVKALTGFASHPDVLDRAGARDADMLIAATYADEVNMIACQVAHSLFGVPTKIARIRQQSYLAPEWSDLFARDQLPIDVVISPEREVAAAINRRLQVPGAFDIIPLAGGKVSLIGVHCTEDTPVINTPLRQLTGLFPDLRIVVVAIVRDDRAEVPAPHDQMYAGDDVYFVADTGHLSRALAVFGHEEREARRVVIVGGGNIGLSLARMMEEHSHGVSLKIIEHNKQRAESVARTLERAVVIHGDVLDSEILEESNVQGADTIVAVTNDDEVNILASMLAKRHGCRRAVTLINKASYSPLVSSLAIDTVVSPQAITVSTILQHVRRGRIRSVHSLGEGLGEIIEVDALETSALAGVPIRDAKLPDDVLIGAIVRDGEVVTPRADTVIKPRDRVIVFAAPGAVRKVEKLFAVRLEFF